ncbi:MAG: calcium-binding protein, partial [Campylobacter hominis]
MGNSHNRIHKAEVELNKAYERLLKNANLTKELILISLANGMKIEELLTKTKTLTIPDADTRKELERKFKNLGLGANAVKDLLNGKDLRIIVQDGLVDKALDKITDKLSTKFNPVIGWFTTGMDIGNLINQATGFEETSLNKLIKNKLEELQGTTSDLPDSEMLKKGILKITMHNGDIYERPLIDIANNKNFLSGDSKDDVLFGGNGNDMLIGHGGADILIGGNGKDDYFVDNGDIIEDSDGNGRVFLENHQLTGGTQIEKGSQIYKGKDGTKYELKNGNLIINDDITIENFSNDKLE